MSTSSLGSSALGPASTKAAGEFFARTFRGLGRSLSLRCGQTIRLDPDAASLIDAPGVRLLLPADGAVLALDVNGWDSDPILCVTGRPLAQTLVGLMKGEAPMQVRERHDAAADLGEEENTALKEIGNLLLLTLHDAVRTAGGTLESARNPRVIGLSGSSWEAGQDPLHEENWLVAPGSLAIEGQTGDPIYCLLPWNAARHLVPEVARESECLAPAALPAEAASDTPSETEVPFTPAGETPEEHATAPGTTPVPLLLCVGSEEMAISLGRLLEGVSVEAIPNTGALVARLEAGAEPRLVVGVVRPGQEPMLQTLAGLRGHPALPPASMVIILQDPVRSLVVACGRLGLVNVFPATTDPEVLKRRLQPALA